jgi:hypothetical protein
MFANPTTACRHALILDKIMKKVILMAAVAVMTSIGAMAQNFDKGDWFVGIHTTNLDISRAFGKDPWPETNIDLDATGGLFLSDKFAIDALAGFSYRRYPIFSSDEFDEFEEYEWWADFAIGVGARYYPVGNLFVRAGYRGYATCDSSFVSYVDAKVGYDLFIAKNVFFETAAYYEKNLNRSFFETEIPGKPGDNVIGLSLGIGVRF